MNNLEQLFKTRIDNKYAILNKLLGSGSFGQIYLGVHIEKNEAVAIKIEDAKKQNVQLLYEAKVLKSLQGKIPHLYYSGIVQGYNVVVLEVLGPNIEDLFNLCNQKFSLKTILMIFDQCMQRLESMHSKSYLHRDVKPDNFVLGLLKKSNVIHVIDFGISKKYKDSKTLQHITYRENKSMVGTARYASINSHLGIELSRRDDLESLGYCMVYLFKGFLPWQGIKANNKQEKYNKILEKKMSTPIEVLCKGMPKEFSVYLHYVRNMKFDEKPDYHFIRRLFKELFFKKDLQWDYLFDWAMPNPQNPADFIRTYVRDEGKPEEKITITFNNQPPQPPQEILEENDVRGENNNNNFIENETPKDAFMNSPKLISQEAEDQHSNYQANENEQQQDQQQQVQQNGDILNDSKENNIDQLQNKSLFD